MQRLVEWSQIARKQGLLGLESQIDRERDDFIRKGLQLVVDGGEPDVIRSILEVDLRAARRRTCARPRYSKAWACTPPRWASSVQCSDSWR